MSWNTESTATATGGQIEGGTPTIFVTDMERAVQFYTTSLGLKVLYRAGNEFAMIDAGAGTKIGLHPATNPKAPRPGTHGSIQVGLNVTQPIETVVADLTKRGVRFDGPVLDDGAVKIAFFGDPDGNDLYLCEVKKWS